MKKIIIFLLIIIIGLGSIYGIRKYLHRSIPIASDIAIGQQASDFTLTSLNGTQINLSDYKGKLVLLNFWASWCPPCQKEIPGFIKVQEAFKDKPFTIIGVSLEDKEETLNFVEKNQINYPVTYGEDEGYKVAILYGMKVIPLNVLISSDQKILATYYELSESKLTSIIEEHIQK